MRIICKKKLGIRTAKRLSNLCSIFQLEINAISKAGGLLLGSRELETTVRILSDSKAAISAIGGISTAYKPVALCQRRFQERSNIT